MDRLKEMRKKVNRAIKEFLHEEEPPRLYEAVRYLPLAGGKRLRPIMALLACQAVGGEQTLALPYGAALEIIHTFTLAHDDIMDRDEQRRGMPATHVKFGEATAILAGDTLFAKAFEIVAGARLPAEVVARLVHSMALMSKEICEGQQMDMCFEELEEVDEAAFLAMIEKKTARLFEHACLGGALIGGGSREQQATLGDYGRWVGMAFQLWDDCLDVVGKDIGKPIGSDVREGKKTLIYIYAREHSDHTGWIPYHGKHDASPAEIQQVLQAFAASGAIDHATQKARGYAERARKALAPLPESESKRLLMDLADFAVSRGT